jgi:4-aminobutyrate aminotransferase-like enzyme
VRGLGAMQAIELVTATGAPDGARAAAVQREAAARGLLVLTAGTSGNVIRLLMPLSIPRDVLQRGLDVLEGALAATRGSSSVGSAA